jgi:hypothetical protein
MKKLIDTIVISKLISVSTLGMILIFSFACSSKEIQKSKESPSQEVILLEKENFESKQKEIKHKK